MTDDDRTVDADESAMEELRRLAGEARAEEAVSDDVTVDADESAMEELRRLAGEARAEPAVPDDGTVGADSNAPDEPNPSGPEAAEHVSPDVGVDASLGPVAAAWPAPTVDDEHTQSRRGRADAGERSRPVGSAWTPPPRMVMPTEPEKRPEVHHGPWRTIALALAAVVVVLAVVVVVVLVTGDDDPPDDPSDSVPVTGVVEGLEPGGGGG